MKRIVNYLLIIILIGILGFLIYLTFFNEEEILPRKENVSFSLLSDNLVLQVGSSFPLKNYINTNAELLNQLNYVESNPEILKIDSNGIIHTLKEGNSYIGISYGQKIVGLLVYVTNYNVIDGFMVLPGDIIVNEAVIELLVDEERELFIDVIPSNAHKEYLKIISSNEEIVQVNNDKIKAFQEGEAIINIESINGIIKSINVKVSKKEVKVTGIVLKSKEMQLNFNETKKIPYKIVPENATNQEVLVTIADTNILQNNGDMITGINKGTNNVMITTKDGNYQEIIQVTVRTAYDDNIINDSKNGVNKACNSSNTLDQEFNNCFKKIP